MSDCDEWEGTYGGNGYGLISLGFVDGKRVRMLPHRLVMMQEVGHLGRWDFVCHTCDNPRCIKLEHLYVGTPKDNMQDKVRRGRHSESRKIHCPRGHEYDYKSPSKGHRRCTKCDSQNYYLRKKEAV